MTTHNDDLNEMIKFYVKLRYHLKKKYYVLLGYDCSIIEKNLIPSEVINNIDFNCLFSERLTYCKKLESTCNQLQKTIDDEIKIRQEGNAEFFELVKRTENKRVETSEFLESVEQYELN